MSKFIPVETPGGIVWAEVDQTSEEMSELVLVSAHDKVSKSFQDAVGSLRKNAQFLMDSLEELAPQEVEITFGIKAGVEGGTPFFGLAKASAEGSYTVKLKWEGNGKEKE